MEEDPIVMPLFWANSLSAVLHGLYDFDFYRPVCLLSMFHHDLLSKGTLKQKLKHFLQSFGTNICLLVIGVATASVLDCASFL